jgi:uncharacterized protein (DUF1499 family)
MRFVSGLVQIVFFLVLIGVSLLAAGIIANRLPLTAPPGFFNRLTTYLTTNVAETSEHSPFPELRTRRYDAPPALLFDYVRRAVQSLKWDITVLDAEKHEIQAVVKTRVWGFQDDVTIWTPPAQPEGSWLVVRSASRVGRGDLGANTRHIMDLVQAVNATVPVQALIPQRERDEPESEQQETPGSDRPGDEQKEEDGEGAAKPDDGTS